MVDDFRAFQDQLWMKIILERHDYVLLGAIHRSPLQSLDKTVPVIVSAKKKGADLKPPYLVIRIDFKIKGVEWKNERRISGAPPNVEVFLQVVRDCLLFQHVEQPTSNSLFTELHQNKQSAEI